MTPDERIEKLLNRAGQTISDLQGWNADMQCLINAKKAAYSGTGYPGAQKIKRITAAEEIPLLEYILHLTDIIDRMETALENVCGERDYLCDRSGCEFCAYERIDGDKMPCRGCTVTKNLYEFAGVPEDWSADDD